jgi:alpha-1,3-rhamnosyl/mannosyltransferase
VLGAPNEGAWAKLCTALGLPEIAGDAALLVDPADEDAISAALERILTDVDLASDLRQRGPRQAAGFTWAATARATLQAYGLVTGAA